MLQLYVCMYIYRTPKMVNIEKVNVDVNSN